MLTSRGRINLKNAKFARDDEPLDPDGPDVCRRWSKGYLRHLLMVDEPTAGRLLTLHNLAWLRDLVLRTRSAIVAGQLDELRREVAGYWS